MHLYLRKGILLLLSLLALAACGAQQITAEQIVERMQRSRAETSAAHATVTLDASSDQQSGKLVVEGWMEKTGQVDEAGQPISKLRIEVKESDKPELVGTLLVSDGETFWLHKPGDNRVITGRRSDMPEGVGGAGGPTTQVLQDMLTRGLDALNVEVLGEELIAGVNTWKLKLTPKSDTQEQLQLDGIVDATMWVDEARALPLKLQVDAGDMGNALVEVSSIETNIDIADDLFIFTPDAGAEVVQVADLIARNRPQSLTLDEARGRVSFTLLAPETLPGGATLIEVQLVGDKTVIQNYAGSGISFSLVQSGEDVGQERPAPAGSQAQQVTVRGQSATLITGSGTEQGSLLRWQEGGVRFVVAGTLSASDAQQIAESLK